MWNDVNVVIIKVAAIISPRSKVFRKKLFLYYKFPIFPLILVNIDVNVFYELLHPANFSGTCVTNCHREIGANRIMFPAIQRLSTHNAHDKAIIAYVLLIVKNFICETIPTNLRPDYGLRLNKFPIGRMITTNLTHKGPVPRFCL